jgi:hypothetical protein
MRQFAFGLAALFFAAGVRAADTGVITGTVDRCGGVTAVAAVDRDQPDRRHAGTIDSRTGRFTIKSLPLAATYDVILTSGDAVLEGVNIKVPRSDFEEEQPLTKEDVEKLRKIALSLNKFENEIDVLGVFGNIQHAAVVLNKRRTDAVYGSKPGEMIWRLEVWRFERPEVDHWVKRQDEIATVHYRKRLPKDEFAKLSVTLDPALGGIELTEDKPQARLDPVKLPGAKPGIRLREPKEKK